MYETTSTDRLEVLERDLRVRIQVLRGAVTAMQHYATSGKAESRIQQVRLAVLIRAVEERTHELHAVRAELETRRAGDAGSLPDERRSA